MHVTRVSSNIINLISLIPTAARRRNVNLNRMQLEEILGELKASGKKTRHVYRYVDSEQPTSHQVLRLNYDNFNELLPN